MERLWAVLAVVGACYSPTVQTGAPCTTQDQCPSGLRCVAGSCELGPGGTDAAVADGTSGNDGGDDDAADAPAGADAPPSTVWGTPSKVEGVDTVAAESDPSITADRLTLMFIRNDDIFIATRASTSDAFSAVQVVAALSSPAQEHSPEISPDGGTVYFTSARDATDAVYVSLRQGGGWTVPMVVPELSLAGVNDVAISPDGLTALIAAGPSGDRKIYRATRGSLGAGFSTPSLEPVLNALTNRAAPSTTNNGAIAYLHANVNGERDLFVATRQGNGYAAATPITELNTSGRDASPFVLQSNDYMVFERDGVLYQTQR